MTTITPPRPPADVAGGRRGLNTVARVRAASHTTPGRYRLWSLGAAAVLVIATVAATASAAAMRSSTRRAETNSGPVLVATQQLVASLAEADAAGSAAFLSGRDEDPEQRRLYEEALARSNQQVEEIASLAGQDPEVRASLGRISVGITRYAGLVEAARASNRNGSADATAYLVSAVRLVEQLVQGDVKDLTDSTQAALAQDRDERSQGFLVAVATLLAVLAVLVLGQIAMLNASRRILNLPLALATVLALVAAGWLVAVNRSSGNDLADAQRRGYDSIVLTAQLGSAGFGAKSAETLAVITGDTGQRTRADSDATTVDALLAQASAAADTARERAAVKEAGVRWQRYEATVAALRAAPNAAAARAVAVGPANSDFNGFNFSTQLVLSQNRDQFLGELASAAQRTSRVPLAVLLLLLAALAAMFWGFQLRINDYR